MTQSGMMIALAGPKVIVTLVPVRTPIIALFSIPRQTLVSFYGEPDPAPCQKCVVTADNSCQSGTGSSYFRTGDGIRACVKNRGVAAFAAAKSEGRQVGGCRKMFFLNLQRCGRMRKRADPTADYFWIFPNWMLNCYPDNISVNIVLPLARERPVAIVEWYLEEHTGIRRPGLRWNSADQIQREMSASRKGAKESAIAELLAGRFSVKQEKGVHAFHRMYAESDERQLVRAVTQAKNHPICNFLPTT